MICSVHVHQNIKQKCNELQIPSDLSQKILNDIFGIKIGDLFVEGIVDAMDDDDFQKKLDTVIAAWEDHAVSSTADVNGFIRWFKLNKSLVV